ncbi:glycosyltransferase family 39 protein [Ruminiclostridium cellobioparum]|uniref:Glycosyltransferase RgtA/B/C/D-like domain-containing protein n=1 Tax=Ruminiclostridium cellobioparum subsp. termitidis CT1112 TaxID=1195236 RepID=S0FMW4_RUMCE|nr:glycosyltransferase family 39 protein [Ruminiclostridium cellobioparum]EMS69823.1 hypothetical protein CTER_4638 [Ruminiclostridium cellobioparum subsp. termitidis CT1112]
MEPRPASVLSKLIILITAIFVTYIIILNLWFSVYTNSILYALITIPVFAAVLFLSLKMNILPASFAIMVFIMAFLFKGTLAFFADTRPVSDFSLFYKYAVDLIQGKKALEQYLYFKTWAYQTGPVIYYAGIMKLFGTGLLPLKLVNCFFMAGSNMLVYLIARKVSNDFTARFISFLYLIYPAPYFLAAVLTNQHFAACMFLAGIYLLLLEHKNILVRGIAAAIFIAAGNAVRPLGPVIITAVVVWCIVEALNHKSVAKILLSAVLVAVYLTANLGLSAAVKSTGINAEGLNNNFPLWKFVAGLNQQSKGQFSYDDQNKIYVIEDFSKRNKVALKTIKERVSVEPHKLLEFFGTKVLVMWAEFDTLAWEFYEDDNGKLKAPARMEKAEQVAVRVEKMFYILVFLLLLTGLIKALASRDIPSGIKLLSIILLCYFGVHLLIEIQVRYRYFAVLIVFILAASGSEVLFTSFKKYKKSSML